MELSIIAKYLCWTEIMGPATFVQTPECAQLAPVSPSIVIQSTPQCSWQDPDCQRVQTDSVVLLVSDTGLLGVQGAAVLDDADHVGEADILYWHLLGEMVQQLDLVTVRLLLC